MSGDAPGPVGAAPSSGRGGEQPRRDAPKSLLPPNPSTSVSRARLERRIEQRLTALPVRGRQIEDRPALEQRPAFQFATRAGLARRSNATLVSFLAAVVLPVLLAAIYYGLIASNQYVAEFRFAVKDTSAGVGASVGTSLMTLLGAGSGTSPLENYIVADYLTSRQATEELQRRIDVKSLYSRREADWWTRFNPSLPMESFVAYWQRMVTSSYDVVTGIATARVRAFTPNDALLIADTLVKMSEELVNGIANRSNLDAVRFAETEVERAQDRLKKVRAGLTDYRNKVGVIDPASGVVAPNSTVQQTLQANLAVLETQMASLLNRQLLPTSPAVRTLQNQIKATKDQLAALESTVAGGKDRSGAPLSSVVAEYEQLELERQFAQALVTSAMQALEQARALASAQHVYITPYVRPSLPESSVYPARFMSVVVVGLLAFGLWVIGLLTIRAIRERFA